MDKIDISLCNVWCRPLLPVLIKIVSVFERSDTSYIKRSFWILKENVMFGLVVAHLLHVQWHNDCALAHKWYNRIAAVEKRSSHRARTCRTVQVPPTICGFAISTPCPTVWPSALWTQHVLQLSDNMEEMVRAGEQFPVLCRHMEGANRLHLFTHCVASG